MMIADVPSTHDGGARLLDAEELAARWRVRKAHVYRLAREGVIPTVHVGRYPRFRLSAIEEWESAQEAQAA